MDQTAVENNMMGNLQEIPDSDSERKIDSMEKELQILKGSIKKIMIDIREQMNKANNPFLNLQQTQAPVMPMNDQIDIEDEYSEELDEVVPEITSLDKVKKSQTSSLSPEDKNKKCVLDEVEEPKGMLEEMNERKAELTPKHPAEAARMDPQTIIKLMQWTRTVLMKNGSSRFYDLLDAYVSMGYIDDNVKAVISKMSRLVTPEAEPMPKDMNIKECVGDMYALFTILHPREKELDSKMLSIMLGYEDNSTNLL